MNVFEELRRNLFGHVAELTLVLNGMDLIVPKEIHESGYKGANRSFSVGLDSCNCIQQNSSAKYLNEIASLAKKQALPWYENKCFSNGGNLFPYRASDFRHIYVEGLGK